MNFVVNLIKTLLPMEKSKLVFIQNRVFLVPLTKKLILFTLPLLLVMIIAACNKNKDALLSYEQVTKNLAGDWEFNKEHLLGMWKPVYLAYTKDGKKISGVDVISPNYTVEITDDRCELLFAFLENYSFTYSTSSYFARLREKNYIYKGLRIKYNEFTEIDNTVAILIASGWKFYGMSSVDFFSDFEFVELTYNEELEIYSALEKAYSFVIKNDDLFIYFTGNKNTNLLILKNI